MEKTHWKKNIDSNYISGEDLQSSLKGLKPNMTVVIERFTDSKSFDQKKQQDIVVTSLFLKEFGGASLYKPTILNRTNAKFLVNEFKSDFIEDWINKPFTMYAQQDKRHGYVVRFKTVALPFLIKDSENFLKCKEAIQKQGYTVDQIRTKYNVSLEIEKLLTDGKAI
jgi:hypothetical protein